MHAKHIHLTTFLFCVHPVHAGDVLKVHCSREGFVFQLYFFFFFRSREKGCYGMGVWVVARWFIYSFTYYYFFFCVRTSTWRWPYVAHFSFSFSLVYLLSPPPFPSPFSSSKYKAGLVVPSIQCVRDLKTFCVYCRVVVESFFDILFWGC